MGEDLFNSIRRKARRAVVKGRAALGKRTESQPEQPSREEERAREATETNAGIDDILSQLGNGEKAPPVAVAPTPPAKEPKQQGPKESAKPAVESAPASTAPTSAAAPEEPVSPATPPTPRSPGILERLRRRGEPARPVPPDPRGVRGGPRHRLEQTPTPAPIDQSAAGQLERLGITKDFYEGLNAELSLALAELVRKDHVAFRTYMNAFKDHYRGTIRALDRAELWLAINTPLASNASAADRTQKNVQLIQVALTMPDLIADWLNKAYQPPHDNRYTLDDGLRVMIEALQRLSSPEKK